MEEGPFDVKQAGSLCLTGHFGISGGDVEFWITATFAPSWHNDALREATNPDGRDSLRRQITFAVALAETYLFEWVRDDVLKRRYRALPRYFPPGQWAKVEDKWKAIPSALLADGLIPAVIDLSASRAWGGFTRLVAFRNGLVHGGASRPHSSSGQQQAMPTSEDLALMGAAWPLDVVTGLIRELHAAVGTPPPTWLK